ncbi:MAG: hypothetical protein J0H06_03735 [Actinobacteria bacterium]|nr:hypothetical protein [Actinomycetota bacterium]
MGYWRLTWGRIVYFGALIVAIVVGVLVGGGTGTTITAIAAILLALTLLAAGGGIGVAARDSVDRRGRRYGRPLDDEDERDLRD